MNICGATNGSGVKAARFVDDPAQTDSGYCGTDATQGFRFRIREFIPFAQDIQIIGEQTQQLLNVTRFIAAIFPEAHSHIQNALLRFAETGQNSIEIIHLKLVEL